MDAFFSWLSTNPFATTALIVSFGVLVTSVTAIYLVSFLQGREISFWPPKIGVRPDRSQTEEKIASQEDRSMISRTFAQSTLRSIKIFAGDLSWLEEDLPTYSDLCRRGVKVRILTDEPNVRAIQLGKANGIEFCKYPSQMIAPLKASISDAEDETECRALVVRRRTPRTTYKEVAEYGYWMKVYLGSAEFPVIKAMSTLFDELYSRGEPL